MRQSVVTCPQCGYDLRAQLTDDGARCPECGQFATRAMLRPPLGDNRLVLHARLVGYMPFVLAPIVVGLMWIVGRLEYSGLASADKMTFLWNTAVLVPTGCALAFSAWTGWRATPFGPVLLRFGEAIWWAFSTLIQSIAVGMVYVLLVALVTFLLGLW